MLGRSSIGFRNDCCDDPMVVCRRPWRFSRHIEAKMLETWFSDTVGCLVIVLRPHELLLLAGAHTEALCDFRLQVESVSRRRLA
jgi:hypothetical protein